MRQLGLIVVEVRLLLPVFILLANPDGHEELEYYHFELKTHSCVVANGVLSESYFDSNTKYVFQPKTSMLNAITV